MAKAVHTVVLDWDGTLVKSAWPEQTRVWMPGAVENVPRLHRAGIHLKVSSARLSPFDPYTSARRDPAVTAAEYQYVRNMLDEAGLPFVDVWRLPGKPGADVYVDDKAERYNPSARAWARLTDRILLRLGKEEALFPIFDQGVAE